MKKKIVSLILVCTLLTTMFTACKDKGTTADGQEDLSSMSKSELITKCQELQSQNDSYLTALADTQDMLDKLTTADDGGTLETMSIEDDNLTFNTYDSKIIFPSTFKYPESTELPASSSISLANNITMVTNSKWVVRVSGSTTDLECSDGISGTIRMGAIDTNKMYDRNTLKTDVIQPWFSNLTQESVTYSDIFINDLNWGAQAKAPVFIDGEQAYMRCGMAGFAGTTIIYVFVYRGEEDKSKEEDISTVLNSIKFLGNDFVVD